MQSVPNAMMQMQDGEFLRVTRLGLEQAAPAGRPRRLGTRLAMVHGVEESESCACPSLVCNKRHHHPCE